MNAEQKLEHARDVLKLARNDVDRLLAEFAGAHTAPGEHIARAIRARVRQALAFVEGREVANAV
jgi:hypothetical protein